MEPKRGRHFTLHSRQSREGVLLTLPGLRKAQGCGREVFWRETVQRDEEAMQAGKQRTEPSFPEPFLDVITPFQRAIASPNHNALKRLAERLLATHVLGKNFTTRGLPMQFGTAYTAKTTRSAGEKRCRDPKLPDAEFDHLAACIIAFARSTTASTSFRYSASNSLVAASKRSTRIGCVFEARTSPQPCGNRTRAPSTSTTS